MRSRLLFILLWSTSGLCAQGIDSSRQGLADMLAEYLSVRYPGTDTDGDLLYVAVRRQRLFHLRGGRVIGAYVVSTSAQGLGAQRDSEQTPEGLHRVVRRIGEGVPPGGVFRERVFSGEFAGDGEADTDLITSRILWLDGLEPQVNLGGNVDSRTRGIYIHGTPETAGLGTPSSHGCIRMSDEDVIRLFDRVPLNALVVILDN
jgi:hypothetical protein